MVLWRFLYKLAVPKNGIKTMVSGLDVIVPQRIILYPRDVQNITGMGERSAQRLIRKIKKELGKPATGLVTVQEFCRFVGIDEEEVRKFIID